MEKNQIIIHVDMDAFYASVEVRDNPKLKGKPLIIGALPNERGVVATCSYEARKYGIHSAMNIKEAYKLCPNGIYQRPDMPKYRSVSEKIREIWYSFTPLVETVALDEAYLDVTNQVKSIEEACIIARDIKEQIKEKTGLTCSVGISYSKAGAKTASEEDKPDGYFKILTPEDFVNLIIDRDIRVLLTVGEKTAGKLNDMGIRTVRDVRNNAELVKRLLGKQGVLVSDLAFGIDKRKVEPVRPEDAKSISREVTFQEDVTDFGLLRDVLFLLALCVENRAQKYGLCGNGITLKITYSNMKTITRSQKIFASDSAVTIFNEAEKLLEKVDHHPVRLIGVGIHSLSKEGDRQLSFTDLIEETGKMKEDQTKKLLADLDDHYSLNFTNNIEKIFQPNVLHRTVEYMRKHH